MGDLTAQLGAHSGYLTILIYFLTSFYSEQVTHLISRVHLEIGKLNRSSCLSSNAPPMTSALN